MPRHHVSQDQRDRDIEVPYVIFFYNSAPYESAGLRPLLYAAVVLAYRLSSSSPLKAATVL